MIAGRTQLRHIARAINEIKRATYFLERLESRVQKPFAIIDERTIRGFRFAKPDVRHYVILNVARGLSLVNSIILLEENGYRNEFSIIARAIIENTTKLSYVIGGLSSDGIDKKTSRFLEEFFLDNVRDVSRRSRYKQISQKDIHRRNSESVTRDINFNKRFGISFSMNNDNDEYEKLISSLYNEFSNHVHGRYPEMMDIYGEHSTRLMTVGNKESDDVDKGTQTEFIELLASGVAKGLRTALLSLQLCGEVQLDEEEMRFCVGNTFTEYPA